MPLKTAKQKPPTTQPLKVVFVLFPDTKLLDVTGPVQVFTDARRTDDQPAYDVTLVSECGGLIRTDAGISLETQPLPVTSDTRPGPDILLVSGGRSAFDAAQSPTLRQWLQREAPKAGRVGSICLGAFILAESGLLTGCDAVTHWAYCRQLADEYPDISVHTDPIFVRNDRVWTSAGVSAGIDMALAMVEEDLGHDEAMRLSRMLVLHLKRPGGQAQFSAELRRQTESENGRFDDLHGWIRDNPAADLSVAALSRYAGMSERTFARQYKADTGTSPAQAVEVFRVEAASALLETGQHPLKRVAAEAGFGAEERMRRAFQKHRGISPSAYQDRFRKE